VNFVPNLRHLIIEPAKLIYLLQTDPGKAKFFTATCGFDPTRPQEFDAALRQHPRHNPYYMVEHSAHGTKYDVRCSMLTPNGRNPCVLTVWMVDAGHSNPRFVTGYANP
jgi:hypothetical protein